MPTNVWALGVTSLLTDVSSEMVTSALPLIFILHLHASPAALGAVDGVQHGVAALARLLGGFFADRWRAYRQTAATGYLLSALCRVGFLLSGAPAQFTSFLALDRVGKGVRTGPRDALLAASVPPGERARAFGLHRSLDTAGAMLGPIATFCVLGVLPGDYSSVFVFSLVFAGLGLFVLLTYVTNPSPSQPVAFEPTSRETWAELWRARGTWRLCLLSILLGVATLGDSLVYLVLQHRFGFEATRLPLLYVATPAVCMCFAYPLGGLADRSSPRRVLGFGYLALLLVYGATLLPLPSWAGVVTIVGLLGVHYAATDGVFMALASHQLPEASRATGLSLLFTLNSLGRVVGGTTFGLLWANFDETVAMAIFACAAVLSIASCLRLLSHVTPATSI
jgi:MFS family permease